jgi:tetratricopeptide (TPR) repeat protein
LAAAHSLCGTAHRRLDQTSQAIACWKQAAQLYLAQKDAANARRCIAWIEAIAGPPPVQTPAPEPPALSPLQSPQAFLEQAIEKSRQGDVRGAIADFDWLLQINSPDPQVYRHRGVARSKIGDYQGAISDLNQALKLSPQSAPTYYSRGVIRCQQKDYRGAIADFDRALELQPGYAPAYVGRGVAHQGLEDYRAALQDYAQALQLDAQDAEAYFSRAITHASYGAHQAAIEDYQRAAALWFEQEEWKRYQQALDRVEQLRQQQTSLKASPSAARPGMVYVSAADYLNELRQHLLNLVGGHWEIAERMLEQVAERYPGMPEDWYILRVIEELERDRS